MEGVMDTKSMTHWAPGLQNWYKLQQKGNIPPFNETTQLSDLHSKLLSIPANAEQKNVTAVSD